MGSGKARVQGVSEASVPSGTFTEPSRILHGGESVEKTLIDSAHLSGGVKAR